MTLSRLHEMAYVGVLVIQAFPKGPEQYVFTYDRSMRLSELVCDIVDLECMCIGFPQSLSNILYACVTKL
jgi:hypothetical protein